MNLKKNEASSKLNQFQELKLFIQISIIQITHITSSL